MEERTLHVSVNDTTLQPDLPKKLQKGRSAPKSAGLGTEVYRSVIELLP